MENKKEATLCATTLYTSRTEKYPVEIKFPAGLGDEDRKQIDEALTKTVRELGFNAVWVPLW
jgi:hypothetical protein